MNLSKAEINDRPDIVLDLDRLKRNCNGNIAIINELLVHLHEKSRPKWINAIKEGLKSSDREALREVCHGMKGASATVFAWKISNLAFDLERLARDGDLQELSVRMVDLDAAFEELAAWKKNNPEFS